MLYFPYLKKANLAEEFNTEQSDIIVLDKKRKYSIMDEPDGVFILASAKKHYSKTELITM